MTYAECERWCRGLAEHLKAEAELHQKVGIELGGQSSPAGDSKWVRVKFVEVK